MVRLQRELCCRISKTPCTHSASPMVIAARCRSVRRAREVLYSRRAGNWCDEETIGRTGQTVTQTFRKRLEVSLIFL